MMRVMQATGETPIRDTGFGTKLRHLARTIRAGINRYVRLPAATVWGRAMQWGPRPPAMTGAFPDRDAALQSLPAKRFNSYDDPDVAAVNFRQMCEIRVWDYPVMFWLDRLHRPGLRVLDAGGHFGTKYVAFSDRLRLSELVWTVYDLPATIRSARAVQSAGQVPAQIGFVDDLKTTDQVDVLLASGLLQYLDLPFADFVAALPNCPPHIILNKVATRSGPTVVTLEKIGPARVPYQIRCRSEFEAQVAQAGYAIRDCWEIPSLSHVIDTHPALGPSTSLGYLLEHVD
jgi:putative methyltransferase (TIGR04325 family)